MSLFNSGGTLFSYLALSIFFLTPNAIPNPTNLNLGSSGGGYSGGGLNLNKMIFTVQDARKLVANKMKNIKNFGGGSGRKHPPPKKHKPQGYTVVESYHDPHSSEKSGGYGSDHQAHGSEKGSYHIVDPYVHSVGYGREGKYKLKSELKRPDKRQVGWTPIVKYERDLPEKEDSKVTLIYKKVVDKGEGQKSHHPSKKEAPVESAESVKEFANQEVVQPDRLYYYEPKQSKKPYGKLQQHRN